MTRYVSTIIPRADYPDLFWIESRGDLDGRDSVESSLGGKTSRVHGAVQTSPATERSRQAAEAHKMVRAVNVNFFAAETDLRALLDFLFASTDVRVFESYSEFDAKLREFRSTDDLASAFPIGLDPHGNGSAVTVFLCSPSVLRNLPSSGSPWIQRNAAALPFAIGSEAAG